MKNLYICHTIYQILIAIIKMDLKKDTLLSIDILDHYPDILNNIRSHNIYIYIDNTTAYGLNSIEILNQHEEDKIEFKISHDTKEKLNFLNTFDNIFISSDHREVGHFLNKHKISYYLLEDGYNFYNKKIFYDLNLIESDPLRNKLYKQYFNPVSLIGSSPYCKSIEVNDISVIKTDERYKPFIEVSRHQLFKNIQEDKLEIILDIFGVKRNNLLITNNKKNILILTQPLYWDYSITDSELVSMYKNIIDEYKDNYNVYLKPHPRDITDYNFLREDVTILNKNIPLELYEIAEDIEFDIGITYDSSSLDFISCVKNKIFLKDKIPLTNKNKVEK